jgi:hypothetical protein
VAQSEKIDLPPLVNSADWAASARWNMEDLVNVQAEFWEQIQATNKRWLDRLREEGKFGADFASKLAGAHTVPDAVTICQEFSRRQCEMIAEDATHFIGETQKAMQSGARFFANGWASKTSGISS